MSKESIKNKISYEIMKKLFCRRRETAVKQGCFQITAYELTYLKRYFKLMNKFKQCSIIQALDIPYKSFFNKNKNLDKNVCEVLLDTFELKVFKLK